MGLFGTSTTAAPDYSTVLPGLIGNYNNNNQIQNGQYQQANQSLAKPIDFSTLPTLPSTADNTGRNQMSDAVYDQQKHYLDPQYQQGQSDLDSKLANQGIMQGSEAYNREMNNFNLQKTAAYGDARDRAIQQGGQEQTRMDNLALQNRNQGINEILAQRNAPLQNLSTLNGINSATTSNLFNVSNGMYNANLGNTNASNASNANMWGGLYGLGSAALQNPSVTNGISNWFSGLGSSSTSSDPSYLSDSGSWYGGT